MMDYSINSAKTNGCLRKEKKRNQVTMLHHKILFDNGFVA